MLAVIAAARAATVEGGVTTISQIVTEFGTMFQSLLNVFLGILVPQTGLTPLSIVLWFSIFLGPLGAASAWALGLLDVREMRERMALRREGADVDRLDRIHNAPEIAMFERAERGEVSWEAYMDFRKEFYKDRAPDEF